MPSKVDKENDRLQHDKSLYMDIYENDENNTETNSLIDHKHENKIVQQQKQYKNLDNKPLKKKILKKPVLNTLDTLISLFIVTPLVVAYWRGAWQLMDINKFYFPIWESFFAGIACHIVLAMGQEVFHDILIQTKRHFGFEIMSLFLMKLYTFIFAVITNLHWRGGWAILDYYTGIQYTPDGRVKAGDGNLYCVLFSMGCFIFLFFMKCLINLNAPPFAICMDKGENMFLFPTMFKLKITEKTSLYILDCLFSVLVVGTLVVFVWRGAWVLVDVFIFPDDEMWSAWASLVLGYAIVAVTFLLQPLMRYLCGKLTGAPRLLAADIFITFSLIGTVNVWRGIWNLLNIYLLPDNLEMSCWITHWVSLILLILLGCSNSLLVRGVYIDAEEPAGKCVVFPCYYLRIIFQEEKLKKLSKIQLNEKQEIKDKVVENNHVITVTTISNTVEENHKEHS